MLPSGEIGVDSFAITVDTVDTVDGHNDEFQTKE